jgi:hypothetical protein
MAQWCWDCHPLVSVNRMFAINCVFSKHFAGSHWQSTTFFTTLMVHGSEGLYSLDVVWIKWSFMENSQTGRNPISSAAAVVRTLVSGTSCTYINMRTSRKLIHISAGTGFWTYVERDFFSITWVLYSLKACNPLLINCSVTGGLR